MNQMFQQYHPHMIIMTFHHIQDERNCMITEGGREGEKGREEARENNMMIRCDIM